MRRRVRRTLEASLPLARRTLGIAPPGLPARRVAQYWYRRTPNVGDAVSPAVTEQFSAKRPVWVSEDFSGKLLGTGSIAQHVRPDDVIIGSGLIREAPAKMPPGARALVVRGPRTIELMGLPSTTPVGDPGLLASDMFPAPPQSIDIDRPIVVVPHYVDDRDLSALQRTADVTLASVTMTPAVFAATVAAAKVVISSSLHGLVFAESYGIPAVWLAPPERLVGGRFKFDDYYEGTGRSAPPPLRLGAALELARSGDARSWSPDIDQLRATFARANAELG